MAADALEDPAGTGPRVFLDMTSVYHGTFLVFGSAGPPKGHAVYDPTHGIAYYDVGCCSWHETIVASNAPPPPKRIASRTLTQLHTRLGIRLGDNPRRIRAIYGPAIAHPVPGAPTESTLAYERPFAPSAGASTCEATSLFVFHHQALTGMVLTTAC